MSTLCTELVEVNMNEVTVGDMTKQPIPSDSNDVEPYLVSLSEHGDVDNSETLSAVNTSGSLLDDALSAAMEAIEEANRFNSNSAGPTVSSEPLPIASLDTSFDSLEKLDVNPTSIANAAGTTESAAGADCRGTIYFDSDMVCLNELKASNFQEDDDRDAAATVEDSATHLIGSPLPTTAAASCRAYLLMFHTRWRPILRPIFERVLIERLWTYGKLGASSPQSLLLSMWFFISRHFGVGSRTEHARLMLGNFYIHRNHSTNKQYLAFTRFRNRRINLVSDSSSPGNQKYVDHLLPSRPDRVDRCPVNLFQIFCSRRPVSATGAKSSFYLQPERNVLTQHLDEAWFAANALGKNRIGAMLNTALHSMGIPVRRQVSLVRFCDTLAAAALTTTGSQPGSRLTQLLTNSRINTMTLQHELITCAEHVVTEACTSGSELHNLLTKTCEETRLTVVRKRSFEAISIRQDSTITPRTRVRFVPIRPASSEHDASVDTAHITTTTTTAPSSNSLKTIGSLGSMTEVTTRMPLQSPTQTHSSPIPIASDLKQVTVKPGEDFHINPENIVDLSKIQLSPSCTQQHPLEFSPIGSFSLNNQGQLIGMDQLIPITILPTTIGPVSSYESAAAPAAASINSESTAITELTPSTSTASGAMATDVISTHNDDIQVDSRKSSNRYGRSVPLELRELLDVVLTVAQVMPTKSSSSSSLRVKNEFNLTGGGILLPPTGLVTQLLWRARALDDRGPWILTFAMWWLMQHYFGIGSRSHHVRLRWGHVRLVSDVWDPVTNALCEAIEYVGPSEYTTVKAFALLESTRDGQTVRRVYPSSGWAEAEISVASALAAEPLSQRPRLRPLDTGPDVPGPLPREGPNFVTLFKAFASHRQASSLRPDSPFYVQPLNPRQALSVNATDTRWFSLDALGKNRIGALMRNIVDKVVRPNLPRIASAATVAAQASCADVVRRAVLALPSSAGISQADLIARRQVLLDKLSCLLGLSVSTVNDSGWMGPLHISAQAQKQTPMMANPIRTAVFPLTILDGDNANPNHQFQLTQSLTYPTSSSLLQPSGVLFNPSNLAQHTPTDSSQQSAQMVLMAAKRTASGVSRATPLTDQSGSSGVILIPTGNTNAQQLRATQPNAFSPYPTQSGSLLQTTPTILATPSHTSLLKSTGSFKCGSSSNTRQSIAYLTHHASNSGPVSWVLLPPSSCCTAGTQLHARTMVNQAINDRLIQSCANSTPLTTTTAAAAAATTTSQSVSAPQIAYRSARPVSLVSGGDLVAPVIPRDPQPSSTQYYTTAYTHTNPANLCSSHQSVLVTDKQTGQLMLCGTDPTNIGVTVDKVVKLEEQDSHTSMTTNLYPQGSLFAHTGGTSYQTVLPMSFMEPMKQLIGKPHLLGPSFVSSEANSTAADSSSTESMSNSPYMAISASNTMFHSSHIASSDTRNPSTSIDTRTRYIIAPPSASLLPAKLTPVSQSIPVYRTVSTEELTSNAMSSGEFQSPTNHAVERPPTGTRTRVQNNTLLPLSQMTCHATPLEPDPKQLLTIQAVIDQAWAFHCRDFPGYVEHLFRTGLLSAKQPWCLNFSAWFINSVAFEVENRSEHVNLRWGDFRLCQTADGRTEYLYFINRVTHRAYYLSASPPSPYNLGYEPLEAARDERQVETDHLPVRCPCPVAVFKALRDHRPTTCLDPYSKFYLQPRLQYAADEDKMDQQSIWGLSSTEDREWFTERSWGKNKLGSLFTEATKLAGLSMIWLRKHRSRVPWPNSIPLPNYNHTTVTASPPPSSPHENATEDVDGDKDGEPDYVTDNARLVKRRKLSHSVPQNRNSNLFPMNEPNGCPLSTILDNNAHR